MVFLISVPSLSPLASSRKESIPKDIRWSEESAQATATITLARRNSGAAEDGDERPAVVIGGKAICWTGLSRGTSSHVEISGP